MKKKLVIKTITLVFINMLLMTCEKFPLNPYDPESVEQGFVTACPVFDMEEGTYTNDITVSISCPDENATIHYAIGAESGQEHYIPYVSPIAIEGDGTAITIKALARCEGKNDSAVSMATYQVSYFTLTVLTGEHGSVTPSGTVKTPLYKKIKVSAEPETSYAFVRWEAAAGSGVIIADEYNPETIVTLNEGDGTVIAYFDTAYTLNITSGRNGATEPAGLVPMALNSPRMVKAIPNDGYIHEYWENGGVIVGDLSAEETKVTLTTGNGFIRATFGVTPHDPTTRILSSDFYINDYFGCSVAVSGNYAVVGAYGDDDNGDKSGSAYVFHRDGGTWTEQAKLLASDGESGDEFGRTVAISGDYIIAGAHDDDDNGEDSGSAYIFHREGSVWSQQAKLTASDGTEHDFFGYAVSISGDYALIGTFRSAAYIFHRDGGAWIQQTKLPSNGAYYSDFGQAVSISGDYALVGADDSASAGSAYLFHRDGSTWTEQAKLLASDGEDGDCFGCTVAISEDYIAVGAFCDKDNGETSGSAYIFHREGSSWTQQAKLLASDGAQEDFFGSTVSISGDYIVVSACNDAIYSRRTGSAYIFHLNGAVWSEHLKLTNSKGKDSFGGAVICGNYVIIGEPYNDDNGYGSGSAYINEGF